VISLSTARLVDMVKASAHPYLLSQVQTPFERVDENGEIPHWLQKRGTHNSSGDARRVRTSVPSLANRPCHVPTKPMSGGSFG